MSQVQAMGNMCAARMNAWCDANCVHSRDHGHLVALLDTDMRGGPLSWRCYARSTLSEDGQHYLQGSTYCTRHQALSNLLKTCEAHASEPDSCPSDGPAAESSADHQPSGAPASCETAAGQPIRCDSPQLETGHTSAEPSTSPSSHPLAPPSIRVDGLLEGPVGGVAASRFIEWLTACSQAERCSCLVHGVSQWAIERFQSFRSVAFFVLPYDDLAADRLVELVLSRGWTHVYVLTADLQQRAALPMQNSLLNPNLRHLRAIESLQLSNEFFDLQLVHTKAAGAAWVCTPDVAEARALASLSAAWLLAHAQPTCTQTWRSLLDQRLAISTSETPRTDVAAATAPEPELVEANCDPNVAIGAPHDRGSARGHDPYQEGGSDSPLARWSESSGRCDALLQLRSLRRLNAHHFSCSQVPPLHRRMYVMDLPPLAYAESLRWRRRVPSLYRIQEATPFGNPTAAYAFTDLVGGWRMRGKDLRFDTGGMNVDTLLHLKLHARQRLPLLQQFLSLPIGRDMMLWNIIVGAHGAYAIDQEGVLFADGSVPWKQRMMPYCFSVQDCYERSLFAICGHPQVMGRPNTIRLRDCITAISAPICPASKPFPCLDGCKPTFQECRRRAAMPEETRERRR